MTKMPHWPIPCANQPLIKLDLSRIKALLKNIGDPHTKIAPVIHVAGTNGKGSTIAYLKSIFENSNYIVHRYISPHLMRFNERITIAGKEIDDGTLYKFTDICRIADEENYHGVTFFEGTTAIAFLAFSQHYADITLLETGMGGRLDATNVVDSPILTIITPISLDHTEFLGTDITSIAKEKAGIIKSGVHCVISWQQPEVMQVLQEDCIIKGSPYFACGMQWNFQTTQNGFRIIFNAEDITVRQYIPEKIIRDITKLEFIQGLNGIHQILNASTAIVSACILNNKYDRLMADLLSNNNMQQVKIQNSKMQYFDNQNFCIQKSIKNTLWPARLEHITSGPIYDLLNSKNCDYDNLSNYELWLDGAHNNAGAEFLAASILQIMNINIADKNAQTNVEIISEFTNLKSPIINTSIIKSNKLLYLIHGRTKNRDIDGFLKHFVGLAELVCCIQIQSEPKAEDPHLIKKSADSLGMTSIVCESLEDAILKITRHHKQMCIQLELHGITITDYKDIFNVYILICGSLYLAGDVSELNKKVL